MDKLSAQLTVEVSLIVEATLATWAWSTMPGHYHTVAWLTILGIVFYEVLWFLNFIVPMRRNAHREDSKGHPIS